MVKHDQLTISMERKDRMMDIPTKEITSYQTLILTIIKARMSDSYQRQTKNDKGSQK